MGSEAPMRDPHVVALNYRLETGPQLAFHDPTSVKTDTAAFTVRLDNGQLRVGMKGHFATAEAACRAVQPYLTSWEIASALQRGPGAIRFVFEKADVVDREPPPPGVIRGHLAVRLESIGLTSVGTVLRRTLTRYPDPPSAFVASPDVVAMWDRYEGYLAGKEPLPAMAQYCLDTVEKSTGVPQSRRQAAASRYAIEYDVLQHLAYLTADVGDARTGGKGGNVDRPHTPAEIAWMYAVVKRLIQRVGEWAADPNAKWPKITMTDFPSL